MAANRPAIIDIVKDSNFVYFYKYRQGFFYYTVYINKYSDNEEQYIFPVPQEDIGDATLLHCDKAMFFMRYIRKAIEDGTFLVHE